MSINQKNIFLKSEGDAWYERNRKENIHSNYDRDDSVLSAINSCIQVDSTVRDILEIGCGEASRLELIKKNMGLNCSGIDPSDMAVKAACKRGLSVVRGTADLIPHSDQSFDIVVFGFCLYLCDREDLFKIAYEADRVLKNSGWLIIHDFYSESEYCNAYKYYPGIKAYKMDYSQLFEWHPFYTLFSKKIQAHLRDGFTDKKDEWVSTFILRKNRNS